MNLAYKYPILFWNCANLIIDSGSAGQVSQEDYEDDIILADEEDEDGKIENTTVDYRKISIAIGKMKSRGIEVELPDINNSDFSFIPDIENNAIRYGIKGITRIGNELVSTIIANRPYTSIFDFLSRVKVNKTQMVYLIKSGAFNNLYPNSTRDDILIEYLTSISNPKTKLTLQNMGAVLNQHLLPAELEFCETVYNFTKWLKKHKLGETYYVLDEYDCEFFNKHYDSDLLFSVDDRTVLNQKIWDKIYKKEMDKVRPFLNDSNTLKMFNRNLVLELKDKYAVGNEAHWEMESLGFYHGAHELDGAYLEYDDDFTLLNEQPDIAKTFETKDGKIIPIYQIYTIAGTVIGKDKNKNIVSILTKTGVVDVKIYKPQFVKYDRQLSEVGEDGKKKVIEKSWFSRGNKIIFHGFRRENNFVPRIYKNSQFSSPIELIDSIDYTSGEIVLKQERTECMSDSATMI